MHAQELATRRKGTPASGGAVVFDSAGDDAGRSAAVARVAPDAPALVLAFAAAAAVVVAAAAVVAVVDDGVVDGDDSDDDDDACDRASTG